MTGRGFPVQALGMRWWVDTEAVDDEVHALLSRLWSRAGGAVDRPASQATQADATYVLVPPEVEPTSADSFRVGGDLEQLPYSLSRALTLATLRRVRGSMLLLHAAGITAPEDERAVVLVAASGTGKSTASHHLARSFGYLSDESIGITADLRVAGYPKPVSLISDPSRPWHKAETSPDEAGYAVAPHTTSLGAVVLLRRDPDRTRPPVLSVMPLLDGMLSAIAQTSSLYLLDHPLDRLARALTVGGGPYALDYRDIHDCDDVFARLLEDDLPSSEDAWRHLPPSPDRRAALPEDLGGQAPAPLEPPPFEGSTLLGRSPWTDAVASGDEVLVLVGDRPYRLGGVGQALWLALEEPMTLDDAGEEVVRALGEHPDAPELTADAVRRLVRTGLVEVVDDPA